MTDAARIAQQRKEIEAALQNGNDTPRDHVCEYNPFPPVLIDGCQAVAVDKFGRFWTWHADRNVFSMIFDPREARS